MSIDTRIRLTSYASLAVVTSTGFITEARAELIIFDVGTTFTLQPVEGFGGTPFSQSTFLATLQLEDLGQTMNLFGLRWRGSNSTDSNDFIGFSGWSANFDNGTGGVAIDSKSPTLAHFGPGDSVGSMSKFVNDSKGGARKSKATSSKQFSTSKGVMDGQTFIGFAIPVEGFGLETSTYGWVDLTLGQDEAGKLTLTINRWAYESDAGTAAQVPGGNPVPGVGGLLALAMGAAGIRGRRERVA